MRQPSYKAGTVASSVKRIHPATDLGANDDVLARHAPDRGAATMFGKAVAIERRTIEEIDAQFERALHRIDGRVVIQVHIEITKRRGSESQDRNLKPGPTKSTARHCEYPVHVDSLFFGPLPGCVTRFFFTLFATGLFTLTVNLAAIASRGNPLRGLPWLYILPPTSPERKSIRRVYGKPRT